MKNPGKNTVTLGPVIFEDDGECIIEIHSNLLILKLLFDYLEGNFKRILLYEECIDVHLRMGAQEFFLEKCVKTFCFRFNLEFINKNIFDAT